MRLDLSRRGSMRARMTAYFLVVLAPLLFVTCMVLPRFAGMEAEVGFKKRFGELVKLAEGMTARRDWGPELRADLAEFCKSQGDVAAQVVDERGEVVWRSRGEGPRWPTREDREKQDAV